MEEYQKRVVEEKRELDEKLSKLNTFLSGEAVKELSLRDRVLLEMQSNVMKEYSFILEKRISKWT